MRVCMMERRGVNRSWRESNFREVVWSAGARIEAGGIDGSSGLAFIDENLDVVERVWRGSGFAIDSLVGSALMKWPSGNSSDLIPMNAHSPPSSHTFHLFPLDHPFFPFFFFFSIHFPLSNLIDSRPAPQYSLAPSYSYVHFLFSPLVERHRTRFYVHSAYTRYIEKGELIEKSCRPSTGSIYLTLYMIRLLTPLGINSRFLLES